MKRNPPMVYTRIKKDFWDNVAIAGPDDCWEWQAGSLKDGYGRARINGGKLESAHRIAYTLAKGPIPPGMWILHSCDNPACCNPAHLRAGTAAENTHDRMTRGKMAMGSTNPRLIRVRMAELNMTRQELVKQAGITEMTLRLILNGGDCKLTTLGSIARALGMDADEILIVNGAPEAEVA